MNSIQAYHLLHYGSLALARAESAGIRVDLEYLENQYNHLTRQMERKDRKIRESKFYEDWSRALGKEPNLNSGVQLGKFLYDVKHLKPPKLTDTGRGSTDKESIQALDIPELNMLLEMRQMKKNRDYLEAFRREQVDGWLHPNFNLHLVRTYRSSADSPNFQNIPKRDKVAMNLTRRALFPRPGHQLMEVDYSGLEVRIAACYHKDPVMLQYIKTGYDMHGDMAKQIFKIDEYDKSNPDHAFLRSATKNGFVFPQFYGDYYKNCAEYLAKNWCGLTTKTWKEASGCKFGGGTIGDHLRQRGLGSLSKFEKHLEVIEEDFWGRRFKQYARWKKRQWHLYQKTGYVDLLTGFRCRGLMSRNDAINYPVQGAAFHCLLWSLIQLDQFLQHNKWRSRIIGQIHDSIVIDVYPPELDVLIEKIRQITTVDLLEAWKWIIVPLDIDFEIAPVDGSWAEVKELKKV